MHRLLPVVFGLVATPAFAHDGHHEHMQVAEAVSHAFSAADHQIALAGLVVLAVTGGWLWRRARAGK